MKRKSFFTTCCTGDSAVSDAHTPGEELESQAGEVALSGGRVAPEVMRRSHGSASAQSAHQPRAQSGQPAQPTGGMGVAASEVRGGSTFLRLAPDNPWLVCRSPEHGGRLFWMHERTNETTWRQPHPRLDSVPSWDTIHPSMRKMCFAVAEPTFFGACASRRFLVASRR